MSDSDTLLPVNENEITYASIYSGIGGFEVGLKKAGGYKNVWSCDKDPDANRIYIKHFGEKNHYSGDIRDVKTEDIPDHDLLCAGFPCQAFSISGRREGFKDPRGTLFFEIARIAAAKKPKILLLENVPGLLHHDEGETFKTILWELGRLGYWIEWQVINTNWLGLPQSRRRVFIIGYYGGPRRKQIFPIKRTGSTPLKEANRPSQLGTLREGGYEQGQRVYDRRGIVVILKALAGGDGAKTGLYLVPLVIQKNQRDELVYKKIFGTIHPQMGNNQSSFIIDKNLGIRRLTELECERAQGFPEGWTNGFGFSFTTRLKVLGNAVSTNVSELIGLKLKEVLN